VTSAPEWRARRFPAHSHGYPAQNRSRKERVMLWLILGVILLVIAIAGGAIVHPILFVLALVALFMFFSGWRGTRRTV
jgi:hypothetical protein